MGKIVLNSLPDRTLELLHIKALNKKAREIMIDSINKTLSEREIEQEINNIVDNLSNGI